MSRKQIFKQFCAITLLAPVLLLACGCEAAGLGTTVRLEGVSMYLDGKLISGLPSQKADIILKVPLNEISISSAGSETILKIKPGDAVITIRPDGVSINGIDSQKIKIEWQNSTQSK